MQPNRDSPPDAGDGPRPQPVAAHAVTPEPSRRWSRFYAVGLGPGGQPPRGRAANAMLAAYRLLGFAVLTVIVVVLLGYLATTVFYLGNRSWVMPIVVSPSDERAVALEIELATHQTERDVVAAQLEDADRAVAAEQRFEREFEAAIRTDLAGRKAALARVRSLATTAAGTRNAVRASTQEFADQERTKLAREFDQGLVDREDMVGGRYQIAQLSSSNLALAERQADLDTRAAELTTAVAGLGSLVGDGTAKGPLSYDVLTVKRDYDASKLALAKARDTREMLAACLARHDKLIAALSQSAYLRALRDQASVAFVPYENLGHVQAGASLYACRAAMLVCHRVGRVLDVLPGEVSFGHPHRSRTLRGRMVEVLLDEPDAAQSDVLFAGGAPLWL